MELICPDSRCPNHSPDRSIQWFDFHGAYESCGSRIQRYRCRSCRRTFSRRTLSIDFWTHRRLDYLNIINLFGSGCSLRAISRFMNASVNTIQDRIGRLARSILPALSQIQESLDPAEDLVADGLENFFVSQDFPNNINLLVGKKSQYTYGFSYALMRRKGTTTDTQKQRCIRLYPHVDFTRNTITKSFVALIEQMHRVTRKRSIWTLYTDEKDQYQTALRKDPKISEQIRAGTFRHVRINSKRPRTVTNDLFAVNYMDREIRKDVAEYRRETVCFGRNVANGLERMCVYLFHHNFIKRYRIGVTSEVRTHAEVAGVNRDQIASIRNDVLNRRHFLTDREVRPGSFLESVWMRRTPTPLKTSDEYLPQYVAA